MTHHQPELFETAPATCQRIADGAILLPAFASAVAVEIYAAIQTVEAAASFRHMITPSGFRMSVAMTNCGRMGWITDRKGYRYSPVDPLTARPWPPLPTALLHLAHDAAYAAGYQQFHADVCLINRYEPGARMSLHQDKDETDFSQPIVSLSLGLPATFLFGGMNRTDPTTRLKLQSGDVIVWGGASRLAFHGIAPLAKGLHPLTGPFRVNLTFRSGL